MLSFFFFFSSRRRHTRLTCDWSSDVCSSDLVPIYITLFTTSGVTSEVRKPVPPRPNPRKPSCAACAATASPPRSAADPRSEERRVGKECNSLRPTDIEGTMNKILTYDTTQHD